MRQIYLNNVDGEIENRIQEVISITKRKKESETLARTSFLAQAKVLQRSHVSKTIHERPNYWRLPIIKEFKMGTIATIVLILGLFLGGSTATVYASQDSMPDEILYPVKLATEGLQLDLSSEPKVKLNLSLLFAERRINEIIQLQSEGLVPPEPVFLNLQMQIQEAIQLSTQLGEVNLEAALLQIRDRLRIQLQMLGEGSTEPVILRTRETLRERIQLIDTGLGNLSGFYSESQNGWENTPLMNQGENQENQVQEQNSGFEHLTPEPGNTNSTQYGGNGSNSNFGTPNFGTPSGPENNYSGNGH